MDTIEGLYVRMQTHSLFMVPKDEVLFFAYRFFDDGIVISACIHARKDISWELILKWFNKEHMYKNQFGKYIIKNGRIKMKIYSFGEASSLNLHHSTWRGKINGEEIIFEHRKSIFKPKETSVHAKIVFK